MEPPFGIDEGTVSTATFFVMKERALGCQPGVQMLILPENSSGTFNKRCEPS